MAARKPLVIVDGQIEQIQSGDTLDAAVSEVDVASLTNNNASPIVIGNAVYTDAAGGVDLAQADALGTSEVVGLVREASISAAASGEIQTDGVLVATTTQWDAVAGTTGGLDVGTVYYLDPSTAGDLTDTAPTAIGQVVIRIGKAISTTDIEISISEPVQL
jgi:hypothetical protein